MSKGVSEKTRQERGARRLFTLALRSDSLLGIGGEDVMGRQSPDPVAARADRSFKSDLQ